ncbi:protein disulfide-isomerase TMX3-like [Tropilaelaps mercedesae]|uniref:Protein disulfide-isomerase TMX3-like n=1 Tax=Tropilaelaps mercedesae TaxID=418985 RepID=A0A1V9XWL3_9ACAR|nr:protein disulfide-isomerase TMX3-like [Tropilaelaps mercedesae]
MIKRKYFVQGSSFSHVASVAGYPDLPRWTFLRPHKNDLLLYGSQPNSGPVNIQIISTNQQTFDVKIRQLQLQVEPREIAAPYEVEMKIINYNVEDIFEREILPRFERVIRALWNTSPVIFTSKLASVLDVGGRKPLDPRHKEGFVIRVAGSGNFSSELRNLELEVRQLRNRIPCPRDYKRTSAEWRFREIGLAPDWCGFRLITNPGSFSRGDNQGRSDMSVLKDHGTSSSISNQLAAAAASDIVGSEHPSIVSRSRDGADVVSSAHDSNSTNQNRNGISATAAPTFEGPSLQDLPRRSSFEDVVISLALPLAVCLLLLGGLSGTSLCLYASDDLSRSTTSPSRSGSVETEHLRRPHSLRHEKN